ncbi:MAG: hypothetical protein J0H74_36035 [Chitinophagaceae bacterium]|nr:hypothetical protein [Chitinophagaceae bacterium]
MTTLPIPRHLKDILKPTGDKNNEFNVTGEIVCDCGSGSFKLKLVGDTSFYVNQRVIKVIGIDGDYFLIVKAACNQCGKEHLIFDAHLHGWNGFVCGRGEEIPERPVSEDWHCNKCGKTDHLMQVSIQSQGQDDFIEEAGEEDFDKDDWVDAFGWITIMVECNACKEKNKEWISYETM